jgi:hypothetical protein
VTESLLGLSNYTDEHNMRDDKFINQEHREMSLGLSYCSSLVTNNISITLRCIHTQHVENEAI